MAGPLSGLRVVEVADSLAAGYCGRQFSAWGAEVLAVEPPGGSALRRREPSLLDRAGRRRSLVWEYVAAGKRSVETGDRASLAGAVRELCRQADVLVIDWRAGRLAAERLEEASLRRIAPWLVVVSVTPFGLSGPYAEVAGTDLTVEALCGFMSINGLPGQAPLKGPANVVPYAAGVAAFVGALAVLHERESSGRGQRVEVAQAELAATFVPFLRTEYTGEAIRRLGGPVGGTWQTFACRDGHVSFSPFAQRGRESFLMAAGVGEDDLPDGLRAPAGWRDRSAVEKFVSSVTARRPALEVFRGMSQLGSVCGIAQSPRQLLDCEHLAARDYFREVDVPGLGRLAVPGPPGRMPESPVPAPRPAPALGEGAGFEESGWAPPAPGAGRSRRPPLAGVRVVDLTQAWVGPYASQLLGDLGADVIKVESPRRPDVWRGIDGRQAAPKAPLNPRAHPWNLNPNFNSVNRNKRDLTLDLDSTRGRELLLRLVAGADIVLENFTPRVMENFGLTYERLRQEKEDIIMTSFSGFGRSGPYRDYKTNGAATEMNAGWDVFQGYEDGPPMMMGAMQADAITGLQMAALTLLALHHRHRTGRGQAIDGSMYEAAVGYVGEEVMRASAEGEKAARRGNGSPDMAPHGVFRCAGDDRWVAIGVRDDGDWRALLAVIGEGSALAGEGYSTAAGRLLRAAEVEAALEAWTASRTPEEVVALLGRAGVPVGAVQDTLQVPRDPHFLARGWFREMDHPDMGRHRQHGPAWRFSRSRLALRRGAPRLGRDSVRVLRSELGLSRDEVAELIATGVTSGVLRTATPGETAIEE
jgi:crotonobetainyl-CoA:carnitine CoA-transferase CaiB-like acyl-CoA transferase